MASELVADVHLIGDQLRARDCRFETVTCEVASVPALRALPEDQWQRFEIHPRGSYVHWPEADIHLSMETLRIAADPARREKARAQSQADMKDFGAAIRRVRKAHGLRQADVTALTAPRLSEIETGKARPRLATLEALAKDHGLSYREYARRIANATRGLRP